MELPFAVLFTGIDKLSGTLSRIGEGLADFGNRVQEAGNRLGETGERMVRFGENLGLSMALVSEGATKIHEWSEAFNEPAIAMQHVQGSIAALTGLGGDAIEQLTKHAIEFSNTHPGITAEQWGQGFIRFRGIFQDTAQAMRAEDVTGMLNRLGVESDAATRLIQVGWSNLRSGALTTGDQLTRTIQLFGIAPAEVNQFAMAAGRLGASAAAAKAPFSEVLALSGEANQLLGGGRGSTMFASMIKDLQVAVAKGKATIDFSHGLIAALQQLKSQLSGSNVEKLGQLQRMGLSTQAPQMLKLLDSLDAVAAKQKQIADSAGALSHAYGSATNNMADATTRFHQSWSNLADAFSRPTLGIQTSAENLFANSVQHATNFLDRHSILAGTASLALTGIGGAAYHGVQALSALGTMSVFAGRGFQALQYAGKALDFESMTLRFMYLKDAIGGIANVTTLWSAAQTVLDIALSPMFLIPAAAIAIGVAAYEIYKHWGAIATFFEGMFGHVKSAFSDFLSFAKKWGLDILAALVAPWALLPYEIFKHIDEIKAAAGKVAHAIGRLFVGHSPIPEGPLRDLNLSRHIAMTLTPFPVIPAAAKVASTIRETIVGPISLRSPVAGAGRASSVAAPVTINYSPTINGATMDERSLLRTLRQHARELSEMVERVHARKARLSYS